MQETHEVADLSEEQEPAHPKRKTGFGMMLAVLGIVYGDIGTSPLYAFKASLMLFDPTKTTDAEIMGVLSLIFWSLIIIVTIKYVMLVLRADNRGEGGILALMALAQRVSVGRSAKGVILGIGHRRRLPVLRRRHHHSRHLGAVRGGGPGGSAPGLEPYVLPMASW